MMLPFASYTSQRLRVRRVQYSGTLLAAKMRERVALGLQRAAWGEGVRRRLSVGKGD